MNFRHLPMFFASSALHPLWRVKQSSRLLWSVCEFNPFTSATEPIRFALYTRAEPVALLVVTGCTLSFAALAVIGYNPGRGFMARCGGGE